MYWHCAIKSDVLPRYEFPKFSESDVSQQTLPNKACTRQVGFRDLQAFFSLRLYTALKPSLVPPTCG